MTATQVQEPVTQSTLQDDLNEVAAITFGDEAVLMCAVAEPSDDASIEESNQLKEDSEEETVKEDSEEETVKEDSEEEAIDSTCPRLDTTNIMDVNDAFDRDYYDENERLQQSR